MMDFELLRKWVQAEAQVAVADVEEDEYGYSGMCYVEKKEADRIFKLLNEYV